MLAWIAEVLDQLSVDGLRRRRRITRYLGDGHCEIEGHRLLDFASNDYLNLASDPRVTAAAIEALNQGSLGARASALVSGRSDWHERLECRIALFESQPESLLFPTGMAANVGVITALCGPDDLVLADRLNHASLVDGCRLSNAQLRIYRHDDLSTLEREFRKYSGTGRRWIVTDGVFSMEGDLAPLPDLCQIAKAHDAELIVDEAHGTGVFGDHGRGACEALGVEELVAVRVGTLSKSIGCQGGFVAGSPDLIDFLWNRARTQIYSTALAPAVCAGALAAIDILEAEPWRRDRLKAASRFFREKLVAAGLGGTVASTSPIVPVILHDPQAAVTVADALENRGFLVGAIRPPTVPRGTSRLRIVITAAHSDDDLGRLADAIRDELAALQI